MIRIGILLDICGIIYTKEQLIKLENLVDSWMKKEINTSKDLLPNFTESREQNFLPCEVKKEQNSFADNDYSAENYVIEKKVFEIKKEITTEYYREEENIEDAGSFEDNGKNEYLEVPINPNNFFPQTKYQDFWTKENKIKQTKNESKAKQAAKTSFECKYCEEKTEYTTFGLLEGHIKEVHSLFQCDECSKYSGPTKELLEKHKIRVHQKRQYVCRSCDLSFNNVGKIQKHMKLNHGKILDHFCTRCEEVYPTKSQLDKHFHSVHGNDKKFQCELCDHISANAQNLKYHVNTVHLKLKPYCCEKCGKSFVQKRRLEEHMINHHNPQEKSYICDLCGKSFASQSSLTSHRGEFHFKVLECELCDRFFGSKKKMNRHILSVHGSNKDLLCEHCDTCFSNKFDLTDHRREVHDKIIKCAQCQKTFNFKESLDQHIAREHELKLGESCPYCKKHFFRLKAHMEVCNSRYPEGERPTFECPLKCGKTFITKDGLWKHKKVCKPATWHELMKE